MLKPEKQMGLVSVIMPVYNAEKTVEKSVQSVLSQSYANLELILVDDGSQDNSLQICRDFEKRDGRVRVIAQQNAGPANARNAALALVRGEFLMFADSDDLLVPDACQMLVDVIGECDLAIAHYFFDFSNIRSDRGLLSGTRELTEGEFLTALVKRPGAFYYSALWNKLYRTDLVRSMGLQFDPFLTWGEDFAFNMQYYASTQHGVSLLETPVYHYVKNPGSTSIRTLIHVVHSCRIKWRLYQHFKALYMKKGLYQRYRGAIHRYIWNVTLAD
ncbi:MAG: glycosyltransferase [Clostridia bacterium]|nr:glycosyltransferase [Clostridia bacterium]